MMLFNFLIMSNIFDVKYDEIFFYNEKISFVVNGNESISLLNKNIFLALLSNYHFFYRPIYSNLKNKHFILLEQK
jgi:hypothetical protein